MPRLGPRNIREYRAQQRRRARTGATPRPPARTTTGPAVSVATPAVSVATPAVSVATPASFTAARPLPAGSDELARQRFAHMEWAFADPELSAKLREAVEAGWTPEQFRGEVYKTNWFRVHGTAAAAAQLKQRTDAYLVPMDDESRRNWALKIVTKEVPPATFDKWVREQAKSMFPNLAAAIDRGVTVKDYAAPYRALAAQTLEVAPESINLADARWRRALDGGRDEGGNPVAMTLTDWERTIKSDPTYGYDMTRGAREAAARFSGELLRAFGAA